MTEDIKPKLVKALRRDAALHERREYRELGHEFDDLQTTNDGLTKSVNTAIEFWDAWIDERNHGFPGFYAGINTEMWAELAHQIANDLERNAIISSPLVIEHFQRRARASVVYRLLIWFKKRTRGHESGRSQ